MMETNITESFFEKISSIYKRHEDEALKSGERFNIFEIMSMQRKEVQTHSALIGNLLNSKGTHTCKDLYLKCFIDLLIVASPQTTDFFRDFKTQYSKVSIEHSIGCNTETTGGRIDLLLMDSSGKMIIIENKVDALEQKNQLLRYYNYGNDNKKDFAIIYLTKDGKLPEKISKIESERKMVLEKTILISYQDFILKWMESIIDIPQSLPRVKEVLKQYVNTIKTITNQPMNKELQIEIQKAILENGDYVKVAFELVNTIQSIQNEILRRFFGKIISQAKQIIGDNTDIKYIEESNSSSLCYLNQKTKYQAQIYLTGNRPARFYIGVHGKSAENKITGFKQKVDDESGINGKIVDGWGWDRLREYDILNEFFVRREGYASVIENDEYLQNTLNTVVNDFVSLIKIIEENQNL